MAYESIVLCKCSGKYIDIYFNLKITFWGLKVRLLHRNLRYIPKYSPTCQSYYYIWVPYVGKHFVYDIKSFFHQLRSFVRYISSIYEYCD